MQIEVKEVPVTTPPKEYVLTLNQNEVDLLSALLGRTGGYDGKEGWRKILDHMWDKIHTCSSIIMSDAILDTNGHIKNTPIVNPK